MKFLSRKLIAMIAGLAALLAIYQTVPPDQIPDAINVLKWIVGPYIGAQGAVDIAAALKRKEA
jgi:hypothetical protein